MSGLYGGVGGALGAFILLGDYLVYFICFNLILVPLT